MLNLPHVEKHHRRRDEVNLVLKPERCYLCVGELVQFSAVLSSMAGEAAPTQGVFYSTADTAVIALDPVTGIASAVSAGAAQVTATWQDIIVTSTVIVRALSDTEGCCDGLKVAMEMVIDNSKSMSQPLSTQYPSKLNVAKKMAKVFASSIRFDKDVAGLIGFSTAAEEIKTISGVPFFDSDFSKVQPTFSFTSLVSGLADAASNLGQQTCDQQVIILFSDGDNQPALSEEDRLSLFDTANAFKEAGGIIIVCGIRASGEGFDLLRKISSNGFLINVWGDGAAVVSSAITNLVNLMLYFCAAPRTSQGFLYLYDYLYSIPEPGLPLGIQLPDPSPLTRQIELP